MNFRNTGKSTAYERDAEVQNLCSSLGYRIPNCTLTSFIMFITVPTRTSAAIEGLKVDLLARKALVTFANGYEYEYDNVSARSIFQLLTNPDISLGFWVNNNCLKATRTELVGYGSQPYDFSNEVQLPSFV